MRTNDAADWLSRRRPNAGVQNRANSGLKSQEYSAPVLGLIFPRFAEVRVAAQRAMSKSEFDVVDQIRLC